MLCRFVDCSPLLPCIFSGRLLDGKQSPKFVVTYIVVTLKDGVTSRNNWSLNCEDNNLKVFWYTFTAFSHVILSNSSICDYSTFLFPAIYNELYWYCFLLYDKLQELEISVWKFFLVPYFSHQLSMYFSSEVLGKSIVSVHATGASIRRRICQHMMHVDTVLCTSSRWWVRLCVYCFFAVLQQWCLFGNLKAWKTFFIS